MTSEDFFLGNDDILERVDEYTLYCHYLEYEPQFGVKYTSPVRSQENFDDKPSFGVFHSRRSDVEYMWKDMGSGQAGDIFDLVRILYRLGGRREAALKIKQDFNMASGDMQVQKVVLHKPKTDHGDFKIRIQSRPMDPVDLKYWKQFEIMPRTLNHYNVTAVRMYWTYRTQRSAKFPRVPGYAYRIWDRYKLYFPQEKAEFKFRNDFDDRHLEGHCQLRFDSNLLIITKAMKDVMCLRELGYEAVAARGESVIVPSHYMGLYKQRYQHIMVLMDNDGKHKGKDYMPLYNVPFTEVPKDTGEKDISDFIKHYGLLSADHLMESLIHDTIGKRAVIRSYLGGEDGRA